MSVGCASGKREPVDLRLTNGRILIGTGEVLDRASILVDDGLIVDVRAGGPSQRAARRTLDLAGHTVLPGLIDTHVHLLVGDGNPAGGQMPLSRTALATYVEQVLPARLTSYLARGITTVLSTGDYHPAILQVRQQSVADPSRGPRVMVVGPVICTKDGHPARTICGGNPWCMNHLTREVTTVSRAQEAVSELSAANVDMVKLVHDAGLRSPMDRASRAALAQRAGERNLMLLVHPGAVAEATETIIAGVKRLVHPPWFDTIHSGELRAAPEPERSHCRVDLVDQFRFR